MASRFISPLDRSIGKRMLVIALPAIANNLIEVLYNLVDAFFLGKLGTAEIAAPSIALSIQLFLIVLGTGISGAGMTLIARAKGRGDLEEMNFYMNQSLLFLVALSLLLATLGLAFASPLLRLLGTPAEVFGFTLIFMRISFLGLPFTFIYYAYQASLTALGVAGAAIATVLSQGLAAFLCLAALARGSGGLRLDRGLMKPRRKAWAVLVEIGLPSSLGQARPPWTSPSSRAWSTASGRRPSRPSGSGIA